MTGPVPGPSVDFSKLVDMFQSEWTANWSTTDVRGLLGRGPGSPQ
jgi:hypothetical protein